MGGGPWAGSGKCQSLFSPFSNPYSSAIHAVGCALLSAVIGFHVSSNHKLRNAHYRALRKKEPPRSGLHRRGRSPRAPASQCCRRGMGVSRAAEASTISAAQYTTCKSPTLRCGGAGADPPASVPAPWYFFRSARNAYVLLGPWKHRPPSHRDSQATARPQSGHSQVTVRSQSGHSQVMVFHRES